MKRTILVLAALIAATPAFAVVDQWGGETVGGHEIVGYGADYVDRCVLTFDSDADLCEVRPEFAACVKREVGYMRELKVKLTKPVKNYVFSVRCADQ